MATNYTGDPTATQAPGPVPSLGVYPIMAMPDDGDDLDAASVQQTMKEAADFIAFAQLKGKGPAKYYESTHYLWVGASMFQPGDGGGTKTFSGSFGGYWSFSAGNLEVACTIPLPGTSSTVRAKITEIKWHIKKASTGTFYGILDEISGIVSAAEPTAATVNSQTSTSSGEQVLTASGLNTGPTDVTALQLRIISGDANDRLYGARIKYDLSLYVP